MWMGNPEVEHKPPAAIASALLSATRCARGGDLSTRSSAGADESCRLSEQGLYELVESVRSIDKWKVAGTW